MAGLEKTSIITLGKRGCLSRRHIDEYRRWDPREIKNNYLVLLQSGDEVLDYRDAQQRYSGCKIILESGGDHSFIDYDRHSGKYSPFFGLGLNQTNL